MSMLEFPTFEEMVAVMNSPSSPPSPMDHAEYLSSEESTMEMSAEDMIRETLLRVRKLGKREEQSLVRGGGGSTGSGGDDYPMVLGQARI